MAKAVRRPVWLFPVLAVALVMTIPPVVGGQIVSGADATSLIQQVLAAPLAYSRPALLPFAKLLLVLVGAAAVVGTPFSPRILVAYYAAVLVVTGLFQNMAYLDGSLAILTGNLVTQLALAAACLVALRPTAKAPATLRPGRLWVVPLQALAAAFPYGTVDGHVVPGLSGALTNGAGVTFCMVTAVVAGAMFVRPDAYPAWLRVAVGSTGTLYGLLNMLTWFVLSPVSWWMGVLHLPLLICSLALTMSSWAAARRGVTA